MAAMTHLGTYLKASGRTQSEFAQTVGASTGYLSELVAGLKTPGLALAVAIERETGGVVPVESWIAAAPDPRMTKGAVT